MSLETIFDGIDTDQLARVAADLAALDADTHVFTGDVRNNLQVVEEGDDRLADKINVNGKVLAVDILSLITLLKGGTVGQVLKSAGDSTLATWQNV